HAAQDLAHLLGREDDRQFKSRLSAHQFQFRWPSPAESFLPKEFDRAQSLSRGLAGDLLDALEVDEILAQLLRADGFRSQVEMFGPLPDAGEISLLGPRGERHELEIFGEGL